MEMLQVGGKEVEPMPTVAAQSVGGTQRSQPELGGCHSTRITSG